MQGHFSVHTYDTLLLIPYLNSNMMIDDQLFLTQFNCCKINDDRMSFIAVMNIRVVL